MTAKVSLIQTGAPGYAIVLNRAFGQLDSRLTRMSNGLETVNRLRLNASTGVTISAGGAIAVSRSYHVVSANSGTSDNLDSISGGTEGDLLSLVADTGDSITVRHAVGNIYTSDGNDLILRELHPTWFFYNGSNWVLLYTAQGVERPSGYFVGKRTTDQSIAGNDFIDWESSDYNTEAWSFSPPGTVSIDAGRYFARLSVLWASTAAVRVFIQLQQNSRTLAKQSNTTSTGYQTSMSISALFDVTNTAGLDAYVNANSGGFSMIAASFYSVYLSLIRVSA